MNTGRSRYEQDDEDRERRRERGRRGRHGERSFDRSEERYRGEERFLGEDRFGRRRHFGARDEDGDFYEDDERSFDEERGGRAWRARGPSSWRDEVGGDEGSFPYGSRRYREQEGGERWSGGRERGFGSRPAPPRRGYGQTSYVVEAWMISGPHTGRGPKGYRRSDQQVTEEVSQRLERHGDIDASEIEVRCEDGVVTLQGKVDDRETKRLAEECAESVYGVRDVMNQLQVDRGFFERLFGRRSEPEPGEGDDASRSRSGRTGAGRSSNG